MRETGPSSGEDQTADIPALTGGAVSSLNIELQFPELDISPGYLDSPTYPALAFNYLQEFSGTLYDRPLYKDKVIDYGITYKAIFFMDMFPYYETNQDLLKILYCSDSVIIE